MFNPVAVGADQIALVDLCLYIFGTQSSAGDVRDGENFLARVPVVEVERGRVLVVATPDALAVYLDIPYPLPHLAPVSLV